MTIPDFQALMLPALKIAADKVEHILREVIDQLAAEFNLTDDERRELLPSGRQARFDNRVEAQFFEKLVVELLVAMGYGGSRLDAGQIVGKTGDGGIDGVINEDKLGLDVVYIQAKRWENRTVGSPELREFVGALSGRKASKGVYLTTSVFSDDARAYVRAVPQKIVLIDGQQLAQWMIDYGVGVSTAQTYDVKRVDLDYFEDV